MKQKLLAEFIGTYALVFCGTGAIVINDVIPNSVTSVGIAITFGAIVAAMIYAFGHVSGAHINPAVTISFAVAGEFEKKLVLPYTLAQSVGAVLASLTIYIIFPNHVTLGATLPYSSAWSAFAFEIMLSFILMLVILQFSKVTDNIKPFAGLAIGLTVMLEAAFAGPFTGASMNPARSLGPAVVSGNMQYLGHYIAAAIIGMLLSVVCYKLINKPQTNPI